MKQNEVYFGILNKQNIEEAALIIQNAYVNFSPYVIKKQTPQQFLEQTMGMLRTAFKAQQVINSALKRNIKFNHALRKNNRIIGVIVNIDIIQFYKSISHLVESHQLYKMFKSIPIQRIQLGECLYQTRVSMSTQQMGKGYGIYMIYESIKLMRKEGYSKSYQIMMIEASYQIYKSLGCEVLSEMILQLAENQSLVKRLGSTNFERAIQLYELKPKQIN